jgi:hypothetical protein
MTLALEQPAYLEMCRKFAEHFLWIASLKVRAGEDIGMWDARHALIATTPAEQVLEPAGWPQPRSRGGAE